MTLSQALQLSELLATLLGILSVYLLTVGNGRGWSIGIVWALLTGFVFWGEKLYGTALLQGYFFFAQVVGWRRWKQAEEKDLRRSVRCLTSKKRLLTLALLLFAWLGTSFLLQSWGSHLPWSDGFVTVGSIWAQTLLVLGFWECWPLWLAVNAVYVLLSLSQGLWAFSLLYGVFGALALKGWREWTRDLEQSERN